MPDSNPHDLPQADGAAATSLLARAPLAPEFRAAPDPAERARQIVAARYRRRVLLVLLGLAAALGLYWGSSYVFAYTDDAYVTSDLVAVAPQITGRIITVPIADNQTVAKGTVLAEIDPTPFRLALAEQVAKRVEAEAQLAVDHDLIKSAKAVRDGAIDQARLAGDNLRRAEPVAAAGFVSRQALEDAATQQQAAQAALADAEAALAKARQMQVLHQATVKAITAQIAYLQWQLDQTTVLGADRRHDHQPDLAGRRPGGGNQPLVGLVDAHAWRILANYKGSVIRHMRVGGTAWVWLDTYPWHVHRAVIQGVARGINRAQSPRTLLPYVAPTTDWIRLERRFPVTLVLQDQPPALVLHMGADARTLIVY